ncbi:potassium transporter Kup [Sphingorhabdus arenilitoris]|uniref:Probable potassium transport system protein Kup n=1 Tax=Sphingorhabdus arenilitoris TaxID=1490041 RepID=A0ABV8RDR6_9SPHN
MSQHTEKDQKTIPLTLGALGIVFGDIGTSPLYAFRESFLGHAHLEVSPFHVFGVLSMITWSLILVISIKYIMVVMRADNGGEGGIIALVSLLKKKSDDNSNFKKWLIIAGLFGSALLYGDGAITPAITVLGAIEGLELVSNRFEPFIIPITIGIIIGLFSIQRFGTGKIGKVFGPLLLIWFSTLALLGIRGIFLNPGVLVALSPHYALAFLFSEPGTALLVLGTVFLVVTGGETLYADMGHFGAPAIRRAWFFLVLPALLLNYFGQGGLVLSNAAEVANPFYHLAPEWALIPLIVLATLAASVASQAVISGVFSLTRQAMQLGQLPRMQVVQTDGQAFGQIYIPLVNWMLLVATVLLVLMFRSSGNLAAAYGIAIALDMVITTVIVLVVLYGWGWRRPLLALLALIFLPLDIIYLGANLVKFFDGGWFPVIVALSIFALMSIWASGRLRLRSATQADLMPAQTFVDRLPKSSILRTPGTAIFLTSLSDGVPTALLHHLKHNKALHENVVLLHVEVLPTGRIKQDQKISVEKLGPNFHRVTFNYGFNERIDVPRRLRQCKPMGLDIDPAQASYYLGRETITFKSKGSLIRKISNSIFAFLNRNAGRATIFFRIPPNRVVEMGAQVEI